MKVTSSPVSDTLFVQALLGWFHRHQRPLPWRETKDPYPIWISEIMAQQTQIATVIPYWQRWMQRFPDIQSLAKADPQQVLKLWEGLGYYSRARNLQKAAGQILHQHGGIFPREHSEILALPGIGPYTAGAIASIAFNQPQPIVDGNVLRVLTRVHGWKTAADSAILRNRLWKKAQELVSVAADQKKSCGDFNQSLMELGALVCTPQNPRCGECPLASHCHTYRHRCWDQIPRIQKRPRTEHRFFVVCVLQQGDRFRVQQRPQGEVNGGFWEFPQRELPTRLSAGSSPDRILAPLESRGQHWKPLLSLKHSITRFRMHVEAFQGVMKAGSRKRRSEIWLPLEELERLPFTAAHRRILAKLGFLVTPILCSRPRKGIDQSGSR